MNNLPEEILRKIYKQVYDNVIKDLKEQFSSYDDYLTCPHCKSFCYNYREDNYYSDDNYYRKDNYYSDDN